MLPKTNKRIEIFTHIFIWGGVMSMPFIFGLLRGEAISFDHGLGILLMPLTYILIFYFNYHYLINRYLFNKNTFKFILWNFIIITILSLTLDLTREYFMALEPGRHVEPPRGMPFVATVIIHIMVVFVSVAIKMTGRWYEVQSKMQQLEKENTAAELLQLKSQLNPHFLFNSLNNIYALIAFNQEQAQFAVHSLSEMLRYQLYEASREKIPLRKELEFVEGYCNLMKLRLPKNVPVTLELPENDHGIIIPPLLFISVVENAFKHGVNPKEPSFIEIKITIEAETAVICSVRNSSFPKTIEDKSGSGIGLENLRKRLSLLYPDRDLLVTETNGNEFLARVIVPINTDGYEN